MGIFAAACVLPTVLVGFFGLAAAVAAYKRRFFLAAVPVSAIAVVALLWFAMIGSEYLIPDPRYDNVLVIPDGYHGMILLRVCSDRGEVAVDGRVVFGEDGVAEVRTDEPHQPLFHHRFSAERPGGTSIPVSVVESSGSASCTDLVLMSGRGDQPFTILSPEQIHDDMVQHGGTFHQAVVRNAQ